MQDLFLRFLEVRYNSKKCEKFDKIRKGFIIVLDYLLLISIIPTPIQLITAKNTYFLSIELAQKSAERTAVFSRPREYDTRIDAFYISTTATGCMENRSVMFMEDTENGKKTEQEKKADTTRRATED